MNQQSRSANRHYHPSLAIPAFKPKFVQSICNDSAETLTDLNANDSLANEPLKETNQYSRKPRLNLSDFTLRKTIGTGTFGRVYLAQHSTSGHYAMKVLRKSEIVRLKQVEHIVSERAILNSIRHPFIVSLFCTFQNSQNVYLLEEYVAGGELFSHLRKSQTFSSSVARFYAAQIVLALEYLHSLGIVYRPENLLIDRRGYLKLVDFGFSKMLRRMDGSIARTFTLCGTSDYLAVEIINNTGHSFAVDWWALGILIYEMLVGIPPFYAQDPVSTYERILSGIITFPLSFDPIARDLCRKLLQVDTSKRLGNLRGGAEDVMAHRWFKGVSFNDLLDGRVRAPYVPDITWEGDTRQFDAYEEVDEPKCEHDEDPYAHLFRDF